MWHPVQNLGQDWPLLERAATVPVVEQHAPGLETEATVEEALLAVPGVTHASLVALYDGGQLSDGEQDVGRQYFQHGDEHGEAALVRRYPEFVLALHSFSALVQPQLHRLFQRP